MQFSIECWRQVLPATLFEIDYPRDHESGLLALTPLSAIRGTQVATAIAGSGHKSSNPLFAVLRNGQRPDGAALSMDDVDHPKQTCVLHRGGFIHVVDVGQEAKFGCAERDSRLARPHCGKRDRKLTS